MILNWLLDAREVDALASLQAGLRGRRSPCRVKYLPAAFRFLQPLGYLTIENSRFLFITLKRRALNASGCFLEPLELVNTLPRIFLDDCLDTRIEGIQLTCHLSPAFSRCLRLSRHDDVGFAGQLVQVHAIEIFLGRCHSPIPSASRCAA